MQENPRQRAQTAKEREQKHRAVFGRKPGCGALGPRSRSAVGATGISLGEGTASIPPRGAGVVRVRVAREQPRPCRLQTFRHHLAHPFEKGKP